MAGKRMVIPVTKAVEVVEGNGANLMRPAYVSLRADLAQWDRDADPDGWIATVQIWTAEGKSLSASDFRSTPLASFTLMPRRPLHERVGYRTPVASPEIWTAKIKLDENGIATVRLPLRHRLTWNAAWGELRVRVGVAGESTFHAVSPVALRTTVLVDTRWPDGAARICQAARSAGTATPRRY